MKVNLAEELHDRVLAVYAVLTGVTHEEHPDFRSEIDTVQARMISNWQGRKPSSIPLLAPARRLYHAVGMEPTRHRPSSEALLRRVLQGKGLYRLDPLVDTGNLFSLSAGLPLGLYDADRIVGDVTMKLGAEGDSFEGIRKGEINVAGRLCLADASGPFGSPTSDSRRCRIRPETERILFVIYAPSDYAPERLRVQGGDLIAQFKRWNGANGTEIREPEI
ncbi:MAG: hypothetical protein GY835_21610 [bacterium]|nr:hypothetical protein [bacterium]